MRVRDLIDWPAPYEAPDSIREEIRAIDGGADLFYLGSGTWALAARRETWQLPDGGRRRRRTGLNLVAKELRRGRPNVIRLRVAQLVAAGFGIVAQAAFPAAPTHDIVHWFRHADWVARTGGFDAAYEEREKESDGRAGEERMAKQLEDWRQTEGRFSWRYVFGGRRSVIVPGGAALN